MRTQVLRFAVAGTVGFLVDAGVLWLALRLGSGYFVGRAASFLAAVWVTWQINRRFTFATHRSGSVWHEWWRYLAAMSAGGCVNYAAYCAVVLLLPRAGFVPFLGVAAGSVAGLGVNFASARWWVFRHRPQR
ncbi:GtrA family protein [Paraburkholderia unamae]|uniref:Flippase GtrA n=1 Tax=Paraburkholderia unamae TaxID=219649 RepID=A0ABX5KNL4_9BURK|nr:GtrA family protein [Paraburkholderia unamae]PVX83897.1 putative flippase GtrA [Paraburkholderia unamae]CAG9264721.1 Putative flippase GtrA [Paraburkholderia unamae]